MAKKYLGLVIIISGIIFSVLIIIRSMIKTNQSTPIGNLTEARFYQSLDGQTVQCQLCPNNCLLKNGQRGLCGVRENINGKLYSLSYGKVAAFNIDPIEKKPFYHFLPGSGVYSIGTPGCNLDCKNCQNWDIAHRKPEEINTKEMTPEEVVSEAIANQTGIIAFTYNEPTVFYEYMYDIAKLAKERDLKTVVVSNGYINTEPLKELLPFISAFKVDLKAFDEKTYLELNRGKLEPVLNTIKTVKESGVWLEIVNLVVPGYTDKPEEVQKMCRWIKENVGPDVPVHLSKFWPNYQLTNLPPTPEKTLIEVRELCLKEGLNYVYTGNIDYLEGNTTFCPKNKEPLIERDGYLISKNVLEKDGSSKECPIKIPGVWQ